MILRRVTIGIIVVVLGTAAAHLLAAPTGDVFGFERIVENRSWLRILTVALAMLFGILANAVWENLPGTTDSSNPVPVNVVLRRAVGSVAFIRAVVVSPIVFMVIYGLIQNEPDLAIAHLLAFQNGFFWDSVLKGKSPQK